MNYRSKKLLALAKEAPCCMGCGKANEGDVVMAHANWHEYGKGAGLKAHDWAVAALCTLKCHAYVDNGTATKEERKSLWLSAHIRTMAWLFDSDKLTVR